MCHVCVVDIMNALVRVPLANSNSASEVFWDSSICLHRCLCDEMGVGAGVRGHGSPTDPRGAHKARHWFSHYLGLTVFLFLVSHLGISGHPPFIGIGVHMHMQLRKHMHMRLHLHLHIHMHTHMHMHLHMHVHGSYLQVKGLRIVNPPLELRKSWLCLQLPALLLIPVVVVVVVVNMCISIDVLKRSIS